MKLSHNLKATLLVLALTAGLTALAAAKDKDKDKDQKVDWKDVPASVQETITKNANGGQVLQVEKETKKGVEVYEAKVKSADGKTTEVKVAGDGKLITAEAEDENEKDEKGNDKEDDGDNDNESEN